MTHNTDNSGSDQPSLGELITLREAAELSGLSAGHLRLLVNQGDVWGVKLGRNWVTSAQAVEKYLARNHRPGPKPRKVWGAKDNVEGEISQISQMGVE